MTVLKGLQPERVFYFFEEISRIPRASGNRKGISDYIVNFAETRGLRHVRDDARNVVIYREASEGYEDAPAVILQGHMDMVAQKEPGSSHDFERDGLELFVEGDFIGARGTTLGADNGIAVAYMLAVLDDDEVKAPALECVFTADEEIGLLGAKALDVSLLTGRRMINLDSESEGDLWVSCAGGCCGISEIPAAWREETGTLARLVAGGLIGGHSGAEIDRNRANAITLMGRFLYELGTQMDFFLADFSGGSADNAIPSGAEAVILIAGGDGDALLGAAARYQEEIRQEYAGTDPGFWLTVSLSGDETARVLSPDAKEKVLFFLLHAPCGIAKMSGQIPGLVETSDNIGIARLTEDVFRVSSGIRSSIPGAKLAISEKFASLTKFLGGTYTVEGDYPAWEYKEDSVLRRRMEEVWKGLFDRGLNVRAIHAGLECGIFYEQMEGLDCVSIGPNMTGIHTYRERLSISSAARTWEYLTKTLAALRS